MPHRIYGKLIRRSSQDSRRPNFRRQRIGRLLRGLETLIDSTWPVYRGRSLSIKDWHCLEGSVRNVTNKLNKVRIMTAVAVREWDQIKTNNLYFSMKKIK